MYLFAISDGLWDAILPTFEKNASWFWTPYSQPTNRGMIRKANNFWLGNLLLVKFNLLVSTFNFNDGNSGQSVVLSPNFFPRYLPGESRRFQQTHLKAHKQNTCYRARLMQIFLDNPRWEWGDSGSLLTNPTSWFLPRDPKWLEFSHTEKNPNSRRLLSLWSKMARIWVALAEWICGESSRDTRPDLYRIPDLHRDCYTSSWSLKLLINVPSWSPPLHRARCHFEPFIKARQSLVCPDPKVNILLTFSA